MPTPRILCFSGSLRAGSWNTKLVRIAARGAVAAGAETTLLELRDHPLPVFDEDLEASGTPASVLELRKLFRAHDGLLIASPEYNSSVTAALKNAIDWVSRPEEGRAPLDCFEGKVAGLVAASPGGLGGLRGLVHIRAILGNIRVTVVPDQIAVARAFEAFDADGDLVDDRQRASVEGVGAAVARMLSRLVD